MISNMFNPDNLFWRIMARAVDFVGLGLCCAFCCLPIVSFVPALSALYFTELKVFRYKEESGFKLYFKRFAKDIKESLVISLICIPFLLIFAYGYSLMKVNAGTNFGAIAFVIYYIFLIIPFGTLLYVIYLNARFSLKKKELFKQAFILNITHLPSSFVLVLLSVELFVGTLNNWSLVFITPSIWAICSFLFCEKNFEKHMNDEERAAFRFMSLEELKQSDIKDKEALGKFNIKKK